MFIFSLTKTCRLKIGFLIRAHRNNIAMSRAMDAVFIVGDLRLLEEARSGPALAPGYPSTLQLQL